MFYERENTDMLARLVFFFLQDKTFNKLTWKKYFVNIKIE